MCSKRRMKKIVYFLCLCGLFSSCSDLDFSNNTSSNDGADVRMSASHFKDGEDTFSISRSSLTPSLGGTNFKWDIGDVVGVYSAANGLTNFFIDEKSLSLDGSSANFNGSGFALTPSSTYYAFYPYSKASLDKKAIPISYSSQVMLSNGNFKSLGDFDYMYACGESDDKSHASFSFNHIGCVVEFKLKAPTTANYTAVYFEMDEATEDNYLVKKGSVDVSAAECVFSLEKFTNDSLLKVSLGEKGISVQKDSFLTVYMMMPPQNLSGRKMAIRLYDEQANWYKADVVGKNMRPGYTYHYTVDEGVNGGFTGTGTGLPNDFDLSYISIYTHPESKGYNWFCTDNSNDDILWATGSFGIRKISYLSEINPLLVSENSSYLGKEQIGRVCLPVGDYVYAGVRQNSSGIKELYAPEVSLRFEDKLKAISENNTKSNNSVINDFFEELNLHSFDKTKIDEVWVFKAANDGSGTYKNVIQFRSKGTCLGNLYRQSYSSKGEALANLPSSVSDAYKNSAVVNWESITEGMHIIKNVEFYNLGTGEFASIDCTGSLLFDELTKGSFNRGGNCAHFVTSKDENNSIKMLYPLSQKYTSSSMSLMLKLNSVPNQTVEIPLLGKNGGLVASLVVTPQSSGYSVGLHINGEKYYSTYIYDLNQWFNFKLNLSGSKAELCSRTKETGTWIQRIVANVSGSLDVNEIPIGIKTTASNLDLCIDDVFYNPTNIDAVSYVNGSLVIFDKFDLSVVKKMNLDYKVCGLASYGDKLVVTCLNGINVYNIKNKENPQLIYAYRPESYREYQGVSIYEDNNHVYAITSTYLWGFTILDITDSSNIRIIKEIDFSNFVIDGCNLKNKVFTFDVVTDYPYAYATLATYRTSQGTEYDHRGVLVLDLTDLNNIKMNLVEFPSTRYCAWHSGDPAPARITKSGNRIVINNDDNGIEVYTITSPGQLDYTTGISMPSSGCCNAITSTPLGRLFVGSRTGDCSIFMFDGLR